MEQQLKLSKNTAKLHQMFGKKLYADKYSFISEICQNAVDSHRMSGQKDPVKIGINEKNKFFVLDRGLSFESKEDFVNKVCTILESGKSEEKTNDEDCPMGMHGIGSISVSAYCDVWNYRIVTPSGKMFTATLKEVEGMGLTYDLSDYSESKEEKSVLFTVQCKDIASFIPAMREKLCYFKDIEFSFNDNIIKFQPDLAILNSTFRIFESDDFQISTLHMHKYMHISLDQYTYPIRWDKLGIPAIMLPIGLKFKMADGLVPDITRENIMFTPEYANVISEKIKKVTTWFVNRYNETAENIKYTSVLGFAQAESAHRKVYIDKIPIPLNGFPSINYRMLKNIEFEGIDRDIVLRYITNFNSGKSPSLFKFSFKYTPKGIKSTMNYSWETFAVSENRILLDIEPNKLMLRTLKEKYKSHSFYKRHKIPLGRKPGEAGLMSYLSLCSKSKMREHYFKTGINLWRKPIEQFNKLYEISANELFIDKVSKIKPLEVTRGAKKAIYKKSKEEISVKYPVRLAKSSWVWDCGFTDKIMLISDLHKQGFIHVYGTEDDRVRINYLYLLTRGMRTRSIVKTCIITERNQAKLKGIKLHNFLTVDEFLEGGSRAFKQVMTAYKIYKDFYSQNQGLIANREIIKSYISTEYADLIQDIRVYMDQYNTWSLLSEKPSAKTFLQELENLAEEKSLYDFTMLEKLDKVSKISSKFEFITLFSNIERLSIKDKAVAISALHDICKQRKIKMDLKHYDSNK